MREREREKKVFLKYKLTYGFDSKNNSFLNSSKVIMHKLILNKFNSFYVYFMFLLLFITKLTQIR